MPWHRYRGAHRLDPFEVILCLVFALSVLTQLAASRPGTSASAILPPFWRAMWLGLTLTGCLLTLLGVFATRVWGYMVEQIGLAAIGWALVALGGQILYFQWTEHLLSPQTLIGFPLTVCLGLGFLWKRGQVLRDLRQYIALLPPKEDHVPPVVGPPKEDGENS